MSLREEDAVLHEILRGMNNNFVEMAKMLDKRLQDIVTELSAIKTELQNADSSGDDSEDRFG